MYADQMILEIGVVDDPEQVGFYSGLIESLFALLTFIASKQTCSLIFLKNSN